MEKILRVNFLNPERIAGLLLISAIITPILMLILYFSRKFV